MSYQNKINATEVKVGMAQLVFGKPWVENGQATQFIKSALTNNNSLTSQLRLGGQRHFDWRLNSVPIKGPGIPDYPISYQAKNVEHKVNLDVQVLNLPVIEFSFRVFRSSKRTLVYGIMPDWELLKSYPKCTSVTQKIKKQNAEGKEEEITVKTPRADVLEAFRFYVIVNNFRSFLEESDLSDLPKISNTELSRMMFVEEKPLANGIEVELELPEDIAEFLRSKYYSLKTFYGDKGDLIGSNLAPIIFTIDKMPSCIYQFYRDHFRVPELYAEAQALGLNDTSNVTIATVDGNKSYPLTTGKQEIDFSVEEVFRDYLFGINQSYSNDNPSLTISEFPFLCSFRLEDNIDLGTTIYEEQIKKVSKPMEVTVTDETGKPVIENGVPKKVWTLIESEEKVLVPRTLNRFEELMVEVSRPVSIKEAQFVLKDDGSIVFAGYSQEPEEIRTLIKTDQKVFEPELDYVKQQVYPIVPFEYPITLNEDFATSDLFNIDLSREVTIGLPGSGRRGPTVINPYSENFYENPETN